MGYVIRENNLQISWSRNILTAHICLNFGRSVPLVKLHFISTNVDNGRWEQSNHLIQYIFNEILHLGRSDVHYVVLDAETARNSNLAASRTQPRIGCDSSTFMPWHFELRDNCNMPLGSISHNLTYFFLSIKSSVALTVKSGTSITSYLG